MGGRRLRSTPALWYSILLAATFSIAECPFRRPECYALPRQLPPQFPLPQFLPAEDRRRPDRILGRSLKHVPLRFPERHTVHGHRCRTSFPLREEASPAPSCR